MKDNGRVRGEGEDLRSKRPHFGGAVRTLRGAVGPWLRFGSRVQRRVRVRERAEQKGAPRRDEYVQYSFFLLEGAVRIASDICPVNTVFFQMVMAAVTDLQPLLSRINVGSAAHPATCNCFSFLVWCGFPLFLINIC